MSNFSLLDIFRWTKCDRQRSSTLTVAQLLFTLQLNSLLHLPCCKVKNEKKNESRQTQRIKDDFCDELFFSPRKWLIDETMCVQEREERKTSVAGWERRRWLREHASTGWQGSWQEAGKKLNSSKLELRTTNWKTQFRHNKQHNYDQDFVLNICAMASHGTNRKWCAHNGNTV